MDVSHAACLASTGEGHSSSSPAGPEAEEYPAYGHIEHALNMISA